MRVEVRPVAGSSLASIRNDWTALAARSRRSPYLTFGWLESWNAAYGPHRLKALRVIDADLGIVALGLLEELSFGRMRFAGEPVTPVRGLLCLPGREAAAWRALGDSLARRDIACASIEATGVDRATVVDMPRALTTPVPWLRFELPSTFDAYLGDRPSELRRNLTRKLRVAERAEATTAPVESEDIGGAVEEFVRLHRARAEAKRESHPNIDSRLATLLTLVSKQAEPELRMMVLTQNARTLAVGIQLEHGDQSWFYNVGFDPEAARLSPGVVLRLACIREAIQRGVRECDLGPGYYRYKEDLGGTYCDRVTVRATSGSLLGRIEHVQSLSRQHAQNIAWLRNGVQKGRRLAQRRTESSDRG